MDDGARQRVWRRSRRSGAPHDAERRDLVARPVYAPFVDRVPDLDVAVAVAVRRHVARRRHARPQIRLQVLDRDQHRRFRRRRRPARVEHVRVRVDQPGQDGGSSEVDDLRAGGDRDARLGADLRDAIAVHDDHLPGLHHAGAAVEQSSGADRQDGRRRRTLVEDAVGADARRLAGAAPRRSHRLQSLRRERRGGRKRGNGRRQRTCASHHGASSRLFKRVAESVGRGFQPRLWRP